MSQEYLQHQASEPLFPNMIWSRPETKLGAGKLLLIGGQAQEFIHVAESYTAAENAGAGSLRVVMPDSTRKVTKMLPHIEYAPANTSGSFAREALAELLDASNWADGVLLAGDLGKNSETSLMIESLITTYHGLLVISGEAVPSVTVPTADLFKRKQTILVITHAQIQKFGIELGLNTPIVSDIGIVDMARILHELSLEYPVTLVINRQSSVWAAHHGRVSHSILKTPKSTSTLSSAVAVWGIQNATKIYQATTTAIYC